MSNSESMMIAKQAEIISSQNEQLRKFRSEQEKLAIKVFQMSAAAGFYEKIQKAVMENPTLQSEWENFLTVLRLTIPEAVNWTSEPDDSELRKLGYMR